MSLGADRSTVYRSRRLLSPAMNQPHIWHGFKTNPMIGKLSSVLFGGSGLLHPIRGLWDRSDFIFSPKWIPNYPFVENSILSSLICSNISVTFQVSKDICGPVSRLSTLVCLFIPVLISHCSDYYCSTINLDILIVQVPLLCSF